MDLSPAHAGEVSASSTAEFVATQSGTRPTLTEHGAYLDGHEQPTWREQGTSDQLAALANELG